MIHGYPKVWNVGHPNVAGILDGLVLVQEKIDGSQFSFSGNENGVTEYRSKGATVYPESPGMFAKAVEGLHDLPLQKGWVYRGEYLQKPKHNHLTYARVPNRSVILFDIEISPSRFLGSYDFAAEAERIGLEFVPGMFYGQIRDEGQFKLMLENGSILGGTQIEGVVLKRYDMFDSHTGHVLMAKHVRPEYRESQKADWKKANPGSQGIIDEIAASLKTETRWAKAVQHLGEGDMLEHSPKDIGVLIREVQYDAGQELEAEIKHVLYQWAWPQLRRRVVRGLPEWYKVQLLETQLATLADAKTYSGAEPASSPESGVAAEPTEDGADHD